MQKSIRKCEWKQSCWKSRFPNDNETSITGDSAYVEQCTRHRDELRLLIGLASCPVQWERRVSLMSLCTRYQFIAYLSCLSCLTRSRVNAFSTGNNWLAARNELRIWTLKLSAMCFSGRCYIATESDNSEKVYIYNTLIVWFQISPVISDFSKSYIEEVAKTVNVIVDDSVLLRTKLVSHS